MTYKKFAEMMIEQEACKWLQEMCGEVWMIWNAEVKLEKDNDTGCILYEVDCAISKIDSIYRKHYIVGGAIGEYTGICNSVICRPTENGKEIACRAILLSMCSYERHLNMSFCAAKAIAGAYLRDRIFPAVELQL